MGSMQIRIQMEGREPFAGGAIFEGVGTYERLWGSAGFRVDPEDPAFGKIVDLDKAPRDSSGLVDYSADFYILSPMDPSRGNRRLLFDVANRGNKRVLQFFNDGVHSNAPSTLAHAGNGFLMRRGYTVAWCGWQGDLLAGDGRLTMRLPTATEQGEPITGPVRTEFIAEEPGILSVPLSANDYTEGYPAVSLDTNLATLTRREYEADERAPIPPDRWQFARSEDGRPVPSAGHFYLPEGFEPGWIYELVYTAGDPAVLGLGFTAVRDFVSFLLHGEADDDGTPNPLGGPDAGLEAAYGWGRSQSGRFLREFVYRGFNEDAQGRRVFAGIAPHVSGGGRVVLNCRFAQPGRYPRQHSDHVYPSDQFPFAYHVIDDPLTGRRDGILKRPETDPLVVHTQTSAEYWERRGSLVHTDAHGNDLGEQEGVRVFLFAGSQHNADPLEGAQAGPHRHLSNPLNTTPLLRALLDALDDWATNGTPPPESQVPTRASETAVPAAVAAGGFPEVPNVTHPTEPSRLFVQDHGPEFDLGIISEEPPSIDHTREYAVLIPHVDADGNEVPGVRTPDVEVPLATYTGWNFRPEGAAGEALAGLTGSYLPLATTKAERQAFGDPRPSVEERHRSRAHFVRQVALAAQALVERRLLLGEDADRYVKAAEAAWPLDEAGSAVDE